MRPSVIAVFPFKTDFENDCLARAHTVDDTVLSAVRAFLVTRKGSRLGNMVGSSLPDLLFELISMNSLTGVAEQIRSELIEQFPGVNFLSVRMELDRGGNTVDLITTITLSTAMMAMKEIEITIPTGR